MVKFNRADRRRMDKLKRATRRSRGLRYGTDGTPCSCLLCGHRRHTEGPTIQERREYQCYDNDPNTMGPMQGRL